MKTKKCATMFVRQWTNIRASRFDLLLKSSARWTCWLAPVVGLVDKWFGKQLSSISLPESASQKSHCHREVVEYLLSGFQ
jgi:hypothetical protein